MNAFNCIGPAWDRMVATCFRPFRFKVWAQLALVVLLAGEGIGGSFGSKFPSTVGNGKHSQLPHLPWSHQQIVFLVAVGAAISVVLLLIFTYLNSRARFVLMESVIERTCRLGEMWRRWREPADGYFTFTLLVMIVSVSVVAAMGLSAWRNFGHGSPSVPGIGAFAGLILFALIFFLVVGLIWLFAKDFVVPIMALERLALGDAWSRLRAIVSAQPGAFALYVLARIVLTIASGILAFIIAIPLILVIAIPLGILMAVFAFAAKGSFALMALGIVLAILIVLPLALVIFGLFNVPFGVFFESFALEFLSSRLPSLAAVMHPIPVPPFVPDPAPPLMPPPAEPSPI